MKNVVRFCFRYLTLYGKCSSPFFKEKYTACYSKSNFHVEMGITISNFFYIKQIFFPENYPVPKLCTIMKFFVEVLETAATISLEQVIYNSIVHYFILALF